MYPSHCFFHLQTFQTDSDILIYLDYTKIHELFFATHTSIANSAVPFGISLENHAVTECLIWYQPEAPQTETSLGVLVFSVLL
jgi:hypothetical protein